MVVYPVYLVYPAHAIYPVFLVWAQGPYRIYRIYNICRTYQIYRIYNHLKFVIAIEAIDSILQSRRSIYNDPAKVDSPAVQSELIPRNRLCSARVPWDSC